MTTQIEITHQSIVSCMLVKTQGSFIDNAQLFHLLTNVSQITFLQKTIRQQI